MKKQPTYKLRKLTIGVCSVALMSLFAAQQQVLADTTDGAQAAETQTVTDSSKNLSAVNQELGETTGHSAQYIQNAVDQAQTKYGVTITTKDNGDNTTSFNTYAKDAQGQDVQGTQLTVSVAKDFTTQAKTVEQGATLNAADLVDNSGDFNNFTVTGFDPETVGEQEVTVTGSVRAYPEDKVSHTATVTVTAASSKDDGTSTDGTDTDTTGTDDDKTPSTPETPATPAYDPQKDLDAVNSALVDMAGRTKDAVDAKIADLQKQYPNTQVNANYLADENKYQFNLTQTDAKGGVVKHDQLTIDLAKDFTVVSDKTVKVGTDVDVDSLVADKGSFQENPFTMTGFNKDQLGLQTVTVSGTDHDGDVLTKTVTVKVISGDVDQDLKDINTALTDLAGHSKDYIESDNGLKKIQNTYPDATITGNYLADENKYQFQVSQGDKKNAQLTIDVAKDFTLEGKTVTKGQDIDVKDLVTSNGNFDPASFTMSGYDKNKLGNQEVTVTGHIVNDENDTIVRKVTVKVISGDVDQDLKDINAALEDLSGHSADVINAKVAELKNTYPDATIEATPVEGEYKFHFEVKEGDKANTPLTIDYSDFTTQDGLKVKYGVALDGDALVKSESTHFDNYTISGFNPEKLGEQEVNVSATNSYGETVTHTAKVVVSLDPENDPTTPTNPSDPSTPVDPSKPVDPSTPVDPSKPVDPSTPSDPSTPVNPSKPVDPSTPSDPSTPVNPSTPVDPSQPSTPSNNGSNSSNPEDVPTIDELAAQEKAAKESAAKTAAVSFPAAKAQAQNAELPQTGNEASVAALALGSFVGMLGLAVASKKREF